MRPLRLLGWLLLGCVVALAVFAGIWRANGGRWEQVKTPSMGTVAPVGSLIWTLPVDARTLRVGDLISFHPPGEPGITYSHRVWRIDADGTLQTKGVIPGPDPWRITAADIVGKARMTWWGAGWLITLAPFLLVAALLIAGIRGLLRPDYRLPVTLMLGAIALDIALVSYRPLINAEVLGSTTSHQAATASFVSTGLLPIKVVGVGGSEARIRDGQVGTVHTGTISADRRFHVHFKPDIPWWFWAALIGGCFAFPLYGLLIGFPAGGGEPTRQPGSSEPEPRRQPSPREEPQRHRRRSFRGSEPRTTPRPARRRGRDHPDPEHRPRPVAHAHRQRWGWFPR